MKYLSTLIATLVTSAAFAQAGLPASEAEVRKVDKEAGKIALKHGEIKNLDMPPMSMVFQVRQPAQLDALQVGQKVRFQAVQDKGAYWVLKIEAAAL